ncbi:hypothetical protein BDK51DRAFT_33758 [Blyttiomyces helicus]|uniref:HNH nuclease domain-containing protein n=1 Tax=Blyttiomyces helicus TaxID=388810 RepID=A0A4P9VXK4_9FUNG|nr:hypothetical protein BDK51DRAFT_33758 [Blyttiomyces helicus]|eukprot:RKO83030.1 hypothetical protein BDK51DRAFT_33758 [Blyttiomyces helicus]
MTTSVAAARHANQNMTCECLQKHDAGKAKNLLIAAIDHEIDVESFAAYINDNMDRVDQVSNDFWLFFLLVRASGGRVSQPSPSSSLITEEVADVEGDIGKFREEKYLDPDSHRCALSGIYHSASMGSPIAEDDATAAHILPFALIELTFAPSLDINWKKLNEIDNMVILSSRAHRPIKYFRLHAALGRVLYASGRADELEKVFRDDGMRGIVDEKTRQQVKEAMMEMEDWHVNSVCGV